MLLHRHTCNSLPHSKLFSMLENWIVLCFRLFATSVALFHFQSRNQSISHIREQKSNFFCHIGRAERKKSLSHFSACWKVLNAEVKRTFVYVIAFTQSAHCTHFAQSPIHVGNGPWCCSGAAYEQESDLSATVCYWFEKKPSKTQSFTTHHEIHNQFHQSINQSISQSVSFINQPINQSINQSVSLVNQSINQSIDQPSNRCSPLCCID